MLITPLQPERLAEFQLTSIELEARHEMPIPADLGIPISALDIQRYFVPDQPEALHPADMELLQVRICSHAMIPDGQQRHLLDASC